MKKPIYKNPWFYTIIYLVIGFTTNIFDRMDDKIESTVLQPIPDEIVVEQPLWLNWYTNLFVLVLPTVLVYFLAKALISRFSR